jgi:hypothetical protein
MLNPQRDYVIQPGDELLALAEDDSTYVICETPKFSFNDTVWLKRMLLARKSESSSG